MFVLRSSLANLSAPAGSRYVASSNSQSFCISDIKKNEMTTRNRLTNIFLRTILVGHYFKQNRSATILRTKFTNTFIISLIVGASPQRVLSWSIHGPSMSHPWVIQVMVQAWVIHGQVMSQPWVIQVMGHSWLSHESTMGHPSHGSFMVWSWSEHGLVMGHLGGGASMSQPRINRISKKLREVERWSNHRVVQPWSNHGPTMGCLG